MKKQTIIILAVLLSFQLKAQDWYKQIANQVDLVGKIKRAESWESIYHFACQELKIPEESLDDISKTIQLHNEIGDTTIVDKFFHKIIDTVYSVFPYRSSGNLSADIYYVPKDEPSDIEIILNRYEGKNLNCEFAKMLQLDSKSLLQQLDKYLLNNGLTRLCILPHDWQDIPYCLSLSDVAMEIIEVKTYCDFFDNASQPEMLFSNLDAISKDRIIRKINDWYKETEFLTTTNSIVYFLDKFTDMGHSYTYTCNNLKFLGDTTLANIKLAERDSFIKCSMRLANYPFWDVDYEDCIIIMLERDNYLYKDRDLSSVVNDDLTKPSLATRTDYWDDWQILFAAMDDYNKDDIPKTLISLLQIKETLNATKILGKEKWELHYPVQYINNFRVCDFALLKYDELIKNIEISNWLDKGQRDICIQKLTAEYRD